MKKKNLPAEKEDIRVFEETKVVKETNGVQEINEIEVEEEKLETKTETKPVEEKHEDNLSSFFKVDQEKTSESFWFQTLSTKQFFGAMSTVLILSLVYIGLLFYLLGPEILNGVSFLLLNRKGDLYQSPLTSTPSSFILEVNNPEDNSLVFDNSIIVTGKASPNSNILISSNDYDHGLEIGNNGQFSQVFTLTPGLNIINVSIFDESGNSKSLRRTVYYSTEKL